MREFLVRKNKFKNQIPRITLRSIRTTNEAGRAIAPVLFQLFNRRKLS